MPVQTPLQPLNVESAVGVAVRVTSVVSSKLVEQVAVHATPLGSELIEPVPDPALIVVSDQVMLNGEAIQATPFERLVATLVESPPKSGSPQVMTLPSVLSAANAMTFEKMWITPLDRLPAGAVATPVTGVIELPPVVGLPQVMTLPSVLSAANADVAE